MRISARIRWVGGLLRSVAFAPPLQDASICLQHLSLCALCHSGRTYNSDCWALECHAQAHDRLLEARAIDGAITTLAKTDFSMNLCACAGSRQWLIRKGLELGLDIQSELLEWSGETRTVSANYSRSTFCGACEVRISVDPASFEVRYECINRSDDRFRGGHTVDATYLCGLTQWVLVDCGMESIPRIRHAEWSTHADGTPGFTASITQASAGAALAARQRSYESGWRPDSYGRRMERRDIGRAISAYFCHQGGAYAPVAPAHMPANKLFTGYDPHA